MPEVRHVSVVLLIFQRVRQFLQLIIYDLGHETSLALLNRQSAGMSHIREKSG